MGSVSQWNVKVCGGAHCCTAEVLLAQDGAWKEDADWYEYSPSSPVAGSRSERSTSLAVGRWAGLGAISQRMT